jgi:hypothetical protein
MGKLVMFAKYPESIKMIGCSSSRYVAGDVKEGLVPMICHKGLRCRCLRTVAENREEAKSDELKQ